jgi:hypothetical protein
MDQQSHNPTMAPGPSDDDLPAMLRPGARDRRSRTTMVLVAIALVAVGFVGGVVAGRNTAPSQQAALPGGFDQNGPIFGNGTPNAGDVTVGTITRIDGDTFVLRTADGSTVKVAVGEDTQILVTRNGSLEDLNEGATVVIDGTRNGDTVDANSISEGDVIGNGPAGSSSG